MPVNWKGLTGTTVALKQKSLNIFPLSLFSTFYATRSVQHFPHHTKKPLLESIGTHRSGLY